MAAYFKAEHLSVGYNGKTLIEDINFSLEPGEILTLIGPNGSGKSTILKSISRQLKIISGDVSFGGEALSAMSGKRLATKLALVLTERMKPELMSCRDVVASGRYPYTGRMGFLSDKDNQLIDEAMETVGISDIAGTDFGAISDGQRQRIMLARAICQDPEIIMLDEPTSFLDIKHKLELLDTLRRMAKEKKIVVIMSLHEIDLAQKVTDRILCVKGDHVVEYGQPEDVFTRENIMNLYDIKSGSYNVHFGSVEMPRPEGEPHVFVISGGGSGIEYFRKLQKLGIPFYAGVLHKNDVDMQVARDLAMQVVEEEAFAPISDEAFDKAARLLEKCSRVIATGAPIGPGNERNLKLIEKAKDLGIEVEEI